MKSAIKTPSVFTQSKPLQIVVNGLKINGFQWNHNQTNKILILHGFGSAAHKFHQYISPLVAKGYEVLAFDAPAHGTSEGTRVNSVLYCEMIEEVIKLHGPVTGFLAHSFGGIALCLAIEKTIHTGDMKIVLIAPATETSTAVDAAFKMLQIKDNEVRREFDNIIFEKSGRTTEWYSMKRAMGNIKASILWVHDEDDDITPLADAVKVKECNFPNIRFVITKGLGHRKIYNDSHIKNEVISFL